MAQSYATSSGTLVIPGAYPSVTVVQQNSGLSVTGVVALVGEAEAGLGWSQETEDLQDVASFGPSQVGAVVAKYKSGPIVDAFRMVVEASSDPNIVGAPSRIYCIKTNVGTASHANLNKVGGGNYGSLYSLAPGRLGNQLYVSVDASVAEVAPATGSFTWIPNAGTVGLTARVNGGAALVLAPIAAGRTPLEFVTDWNGLTTSNPLAAGGTNRLAISVIAGTLTVVQVSAVNKTCTITHSVAWDVTPTVGDTVVIPALSAAAGAGNANVGAYVVTAATASVLSLTKLSDVNKPGLVIGTVTAPVSGGPFAIASATNDLVAYAPVTITTVAAAAINGVGKSLEIAETATGTDLLSRCTYALSATPVSWVSKTGAGVIIASSAEAEASINLARISDGVDEDISAGGDVGLTISYQGTSCTLTITSTALTTTKVGGSGAHLSLLLADFATIGDLATYINAQTGYSAAAATASVGQLAPTCLDRVTAVDIGSTWNARNGRIKTDAYAMFNAISSSPTVQLGLVAARAGLGLPAVNATVTYFAGGTKGSTTNALISSAIDALANQEVNFVVPLFSQDATTDIAAGLTQGLDSVNGEVASTYTVDAINALAKSHALAMSKLKKRKNRQCVVSKRSSFINAKTAASNLATPRTACTFQDVKAVNSAGNLIQFQPWMAACNAVGMQVAGFYRSITHKFANVSGIIQAAADFNDKDDDQMEEALLAGLMPLKRHPNGGFYWVCDQTTYTKDSNFVYNSMQAIYSADVVAMTTAQRMEDAFIGSSTSDFTASVALAYLKSIMKDMKDLKLIAASDDAPAGYKNAKITLNGPVMLVEIEIKLASEILFCSISFLVSQVTQTAS